MTRDEAVKKAEACFLFNVPGQEWFFTPLRLVAALENLGMLKLDEPKTFIQRVRDATRYQIPDNAHFDDLLTDLDKAGLKITEK